MAKKAAENVRKQELIPVATTIALQQLALPMKLVSEAIKTGLLAFVQ